MKTKDPPVLSGGCNVNHCPGCTRLFSELESDHDVSQCMEVVANQHIRMYGGGRGVDAMKQRSVELQKKVNSKT